MNSRKKCRLCSREGLMCNYSLLEDNSRMLEALTSIKVDKENQLSTEACIKCWLDLKYAYRIQQNFLNHEKPHHLPEYSGLDHIEVEELQICDDSGVKRELGLDFEPLKDIVETELSEDNSEVKNHDMEKPCTESGVAQKIEKEPENQINLCKICGDAMFENEMMEHLKSHYFSRLKCDQCNMYCSNIKSYRNHVSQAHAENSLSKIWACKVCKATFSYKPLYLIHHSKAHRRRVGLSLRLKRNRDEEKAHDCPYCKKHFSKEENCLKHIKGHSKKKCDVCGLLISPSNFRTHVRTHKEEPVVCYICGGYYKNSVCLRSHIHYTHSTTNYLCHFCEKVFKKSYALSMHIKKEHTGEKSHTCDICGKQFFTFFTLNTHKKMTHLKLRPHACQYCHKMFSSKFARVTHERQHTNVKPYKCDVCGQGYRQNVSLKSHKKSAHNIVEPLICACEVCGKKFGSTFAVMSHMRLH